MKTVLTLRIDQSFKERLDAIAQEHDASVSEYCRDVIEAHILEYDGDETINVPSQVTIFTDNFSFRRSLPQLSLLLSIMKINSGYCNERNYQLLKNHIEGCLKSSVLSSEFRFELIKVLNNINLLLINHQESQLMFTSDGNMYSLDYSLVFNEVYQLINDEYTNENR